MAEYHERRTVIETEPTRRAGQVETEHQHVSYERRGMSGAAVAAIVLSAVAAAVLLTLLFTNNQSEARDAELAHDSAGPVQTVPAQQPRRNRLSSSQCLRPRRRPQRFRSPCRCPRLRLRSLSQPLRLSLTPA